MHYYHARIQKVLKEGMQLFFFFLFLIRGKRIQVAHKASHPWPASEMAFRWRTDDGPTLNAGLAAM